jgi:hypothetical protein
MLFAVLGLVMLVTANDFGTIFLTLELQSLSLYVLSGFKKNSLYSIESGLKYFIFGALSAAYFLLGWSILYGISGLFILSSFHFFSFNLFASNQEKLLPISRCATCTPTPCTTCGKTEQINFIDDNLYSDEYVNLDFVVDLRLKNVLSLKPSIDLSELTCCACDSHPSKNPIELKVQDIISHAGTGIFFCRATR